MVYLSFSITIISFCLVLLINYDKIELSILSFLSKEDLVFEKIHVTFDIKSKTQIDVYKTGKFKIKRNNPQLIIGNYAEFGEIIDAQISIDNIILNRDDYIVSENINMIKHNLFHKKINDTCIINFNYSYTLDETEINLDEDGLGELIKFHRCKKLVLHLIFPENFTPIDLKISKSKSFSKEEVDTVLHKEIILITTVMNNRKQIIWEKAFPKMKNSYSIKWYWNKKKLQTNINS